MSDASSVTITAAQVLEWGGMGLVALVGWFARNSFNSLTDQVRAMSMHLASINVTLQAHEGKRELLEQRVNGVVVQLEEVADRVRELERSRMKTGEHPRADE